MKPVLGNIDIVTGEYTPPSVSLIDGSLLKGIPIGQFHCHAAFNIVSKPMCKSNIAGYLAAKHGVPIVNENEPIYDMEGGFNKSFPEKE